jgi:hypothetical protein
VTVASYEETRVVSETGGEKGQKASQLGTIDPIALLHLGEVSGFGAQKYEAFNYLKGYDWRLTVDAALRHLLAFWAGEDRDPESGLLHPAHFAWHGLALTSFALRGIGEDTRFRGAVLLNK